MLPGDQRTSMPQVIFKSSQTDAASGRQEPPRMAASSPDRWFIDPSCDIRGVGKMKFGAGVVVQKDCWINIAFDNPNSAVMIEIGEGSNIGRRCTISAANRIVLGKNVLLGPNVFISDHGHEYRHVAVPVLNQDITTHRDEIHIGDETWIGTNAVLVGNVKIGKHCVVGANAVVTRDLPDYCVAVGNPARIAKLYDPESGTWAKVADPGEAEKNLRHRPDSWTEFLAPFAGLQSLQVEVASVCNLRCPQCFQYVDGHKSGFFSRALWDEKIHPCLGQLRDIHLVGIGEPLLSKDFFYFVEDAGKSKVRVHTTSNLQLLTESIAEKLVATGVQELSFSCDGATRETYEKIRVRGDFGKLQSALQWINQFKANYQSPFPRLILNFGALKSNIHELPQVVAFARDHGVELIIAYHDVIYREALKEESLFHFQEISDRFFQEAVRMAEKAGIQMFTPGLFSQPRKYKNPRPYCGYPYSHLYVYSDGRVGPCCMDFPNRMQLGDLNRSTLEEIWNQTPILALRRELLNQPSETCQYCVSHGKMDISDPGYFFRFKGAEEYRKTLKAAGEAQLCR